MMGLQMTVRGVKEQVRKKQEHIEMFLITLQNHLNRDEIISRNPIVKVMGEKVHHIKHQLPGLDDRVSVKRCG
jgi:hypothetical protein